MNRLTFIKTLLIAPVAALLAGCEKENEKDDKYAYFYLSPEIPNTNPPYLKEYFKKYSGGLYQVRKEDTLTFLHICRNNPQMHQITSQEFKRKKLHNEVVIYIA